MTVTLPAGPAAPRRPVRRLPSRASQPPYDAESDGADLHRAVTQGALALTFDRPDEPALRLVPPLTPPLPAELPPAGAWAGRLAQAVVEVLAGSRPPAQLVRWTSEPVYGQVCRAASEPGARRSRGQVRSVHVSSPSAAAVEAAVVVQWERRCEGLALRLENVTGHWLCTALQLGSSPRRVP